MLRTLPVLQHTLFPALYRNMSSSSMTMYIGFPSKVAGVTIVGEYPLRFNGVGTGNGCDPLASVSTSEALSASSKCTKLSQFLSAADKECFVTVEREGCVALHYSVHFFFYEFSLSRNDRNRGGGYRCKICTVPTPFVCLPDPLEKRGGRVLRTLPVLLTD